MEIKKVSQNIKSIDNLYSFRSYL